MDLYKETLMDYYRNPRNRGTLEHPMFNSRTYAPTCGDIISMQGVIRDCKLVNVMFDGRGCVISQATASMLSEKVLGMTIEDVLDLNADDILALIGIELGLTRLKCALLPLQVLQDGVSGYIKKECDKKE